MNKLIFSILMRTVIISISGCCDPYRNEKYIFNDDSQRFMFDTLATNIQMQDNNKFTVGYKVSYGRFGLPFHQFIWHQTQGPCGQSIAAEYFGVNYVDMIDGTQIQLSIEAIGTDETQTELIWNETDQFQFNIKTKNVNSKLKPSISVADSLAIGGKMCRKVLLIDNEKIKDQINANTPLKIYISAQYGLVKYISQNGIVCERKF